MGLLTNTRQLDEIVTTMLDDKRHKHHVTCHRVRRAKEAQWGEFPDTLHPSLVSALRKLDINRPYTHQAEAVHLLKAGKHVVLTTPTASGKSLCYNVPVLDRILAEPSARALYIFPTKALSQDQYSGLHRLIEGAEADIGTFTFDGDTPPDARRAVRAPPTRQRFLKTF